MTDVELAAQVQRAVSELMQCIRAAEEQAIEVKIHLDLSKEISGRRSTILSAEVFKRLHTS